MAIVIGVLGRPNKMKREITSFSKAITDVIIMYKAIPLGIIPNQIDVTLKLNDTEKNNLYQIIDMCDGILLQGGSDDYNYDVEAIKYIINKNIPVLGICLGMQCLALATGGILDEINGHCLIDADYAHDVKLIKNSKLYRIIDSENIKVNSRHSFVVTKTGQYDVVGYSSDGAIEAIEKLDNDFNIGVQWHPEDILHLDDHAKKLFDAFFTACYQYNSKRK